MVEDNINPYQTSPTLTVKQAVMYLLGFRGDYEFEVERDWYEFDLSDYLHDLQEKEDCAHSNAIYELEKLKSKDSASSEEIEVATHKVETARSKLEDTQKLPRIAEEYRLLINHAISKARLGKRTPIIVDEDETIRTGELRITKASFLEWLEGMELNVENGVPIPVTDSEADELLRKPLSRKANNSLHVTLGLLVSMFAESSSSRYGSAENPTTINIAKALDQHAKKLNDGKRLHGQGEEAIRKRIEIALYALETTY